MQKEKGQTSNTKKIVYTALLTAMAYGISYLEFPIFAIAPFLKLDFSAVFILLLGFMFGLEYGISACAVKELLCFITKSSTGGVGEIANFLVIGCFILVPCLLYRKRKGLKNVIISLIIACLIQVVISLVVNRFINFPLYMGAGAKEAFKEFWVFVALFNLIKSLAVSTITVLLYKRVSFLIKSI